MHYNQVNPTVAGPTVLLPAAARLRGGACCFVSLLHASSFCFTTESLTDDKLSHKAIISNFTVQKIKITQCNLMQNVCD